MVAVAEAVRLGKNLGNIPGTWYRAPDGAIHRNPQPQLINLNDYQPDFSLFEESRFYRPMGGRIFKTIPVETYRGCPYTCTFCNSPLQVEFSREHELGKFLRRKTVQNLRAELFSLIDLYHPEFFYFIDDSFLARPAKEIFEFCEMYKKIGLPFWFNTRPENCNRDNMRALKEAGCYRISFGIECGNEEYRKKVLRRNVSNQQLLRQFGIIAESEIAFSINLIVGMPGETRALVMDTAELVRATYGYDTLTVSIVTPYHGTVLRDVAVRNSWLDAGTITKHTMAQSVLRMPKPYLSVDELDGLVRVLPLYCFFPQSEWEEIRRAEIDDEEGKAILDHYSKIYKERFLRKTQDEEKSFIVEGGTGCRSNPKDSIRFSVKRLSDEEILMLKM